MKNVLLIFVGFLFSVNAIAQESPKEKSNPKSNTEITATADMPAIQPPKVSVHYPECKCKTPDVTLQRALKITEKYLRTEKINVASHYLAKVSLRCDETGEVMRWEFTWRSEQKPNVEIDVMMNAKARLVPLRIESIM